MKKIAYFLMLLSITAFFSACSNRMGGDRDTTDDRTTTGGGNTGDETGGNVGGDANAGGTEMNMKTEFVREAADISMAEVQLANLAIQKASSQAVKDFAQQMLEDHSTANDQLKDLATGENITIPSAVSSDAQDNIDKLNKLSGTEFDKEYMDQMVKDHEKSVSDFEEASQNVSDPELKAWVDQTLPKLRNHLDMAQSIQRRINNNNE